MNFSIIIPHYKNINGLKRLIESIPLRDDVEIIIIDDFSFEPNLLKEFIEKMNNPMISKILFNESNLGPGLTRNKGIKIAKGKYIVFADSDDFFTKEINSIFDKYISKTYDIVYFKPTSDDSYGVNIGSRHIYYENLINEYLSSDSDSSLEKLKYSYGIVTSKFYLREFLITNKIIFLDYRIGEDRLFSVQAAKHTTNIDVSSLAYYCYTDEKNSITKLKSYKNIKDEVNAHIEYTDFIKKNITKENLSLYPLSAFSIILKTVKKTKNPIFLFKVLILFGKNGVPLINLNRKGIK